jgi:hypothetical protein
MQQMKSKVQLSLLQHDVEACWGGEGKAPRIPECGSKKRVVSLTPRPPNFRRCSPLGSWLRGDEVGLVALARIKMPVPAGNRILSVHYKLTELYQFIFNYDTK